MRPPPVDEDVRRFFQSPVDAAPGTVVVRLSRVYIHGFQLPHVTYRIIPYAYRTVDFTTVDRLDKGYWEARDGEEYLVRKNGAVGQSSVTRFTCALSLFFSHLLDLIVPGPEASPVREASIVSRDLAVKPSDPPPGITPIPGQGYRALVTASGEEHR